MLRNKVRESLHIKKEAFEAWRRVIEVTLASCSVDILPRDTRQTIISEVLQDLLSKVCTPLTAQRRGNLLFMEGERLIWRGGVLIKLAQQ